MQDAPISRIDLLVCRNVLISFNTETQARVLARFYFALNDGGYLFLGLAEKLLTQGDTFVPLDLKRRLFMKVQRPGFRDRLMVIAQAGRDETTNHVVAGVRLREAAFDADPLARLVIHPHGILVLANERARSLFGLSLSDRRSTPRSGSGRAR